MLDPFLLLGGAKTGTKSIIQLANIKDITESANCLIPPKIPPNVWLSAYFD
jgi:hypothetical protein